MVDLYQSGNPRMDIFREYDLNPSTFDKWGKQEKATDSFKEKDNLTPEQKELIKLRKELKDLEKEFLSWCKLRIPHKNLVINIFPLRKDSLLKFGIIWRHLIEKLVND